VQAINPIFVLKSVAMEDHFILLWEVVTKLNAMTGITTVATVAPPIAR
jgi:hypothetical protein